MNSLYDIAMAILWIVILSGPCGWVGLVALICGIISCRNAK